MRSSVRHLSHAIANASDPANVSGQRTSCPDTRERILCAYTAVRGPFISGQDAGLELAPVMNAEDLRKGLSRLGWRRLE